MVSKSIAPSSLHPEIETHLKINVAKCLQATRPTGTDKSSLPMHVGSCLCVKGISHSITPSVELPALMEPSRVDNFKLMLKRT